MEKMTLSRQELYNLVWEHPLTTLAKQYQISDTGLRKICKKMNIPLPPNGHWQRKKYGYKVKVLKLPDNYEGKNEVTLTKQGLIDEKNESIMAAINRLEKEISSNPQLPIRVPDKLIKPDLLIKSTKEYFAAVSRYSWRRGGSYPNRVNVLNINVSKQLMPRALRYMDALIKLLKARGHIIKVSDRNTYVTIMGENIEVGLREKVTYVRSNDKWRSGEYKPSGFLTFMLIRSPYQTSYWVEGKKTLEDQLARTVAKLEIEGERLKIERIEREKRRKVYEEQERIASQIRERKEKELLDFKDLFIQATRLHQANYLRDYVKSVEVYAAKNGEDISEELKNWIIWATEKINWFDPLVNRADELLDGYNKPSISKELFDY